MFRRALSGLQRDGTICQRRTYLNDYTPIAGQHPFERSESAVHATEISYFGNSTIFFGCHLFDRRKDRRHGVVDPNIDSAQLPLNLRGCRFDLLGVGDINHYDERPASERFHFLPRRLESVAAPRKKCDVSASLREFPGSRASHPGRCASDDDGFDGLIHSPLFVAIICNVARHGLRGSLGVRPCYADA